MFIPNYEKTAIINVDHIVQVYISAPMYEQIDYRVHCEIARGGTSLLYRGTQKECESFLIGLYTQFNK